MPSRPPTWHFPRMSLPCVLTTCGFTATWLLNEHTHHTRFLFSLTPHLYLRHPVCSVTCRSLGPEVKSAPFTRWCGALERSRIDRCLFHAIPAFEFDRLSDLLGKTRSPRAYSPSLHPCQHAHPRPDSPSRPPIYPSHMAERMGSLGH